jgi:hypothetical protein
MGIHPVAVVISHITCARIMKADYSRFSWGGLHGKQGGLHGKHISYRIPYIDIILLFSDLLLNFSYI